MSPRRAARVDANQASIVRQLRQIPGISVAVTSALGDGFPDLVLGCGGLNYLIEIKDGDKPPSARNLTAAEQQFSDGWKGQYAVCETFEDVLLALSD